MTEFIGTFETPDDVGSEGQGPFREGLELAFSPSSVPLKQRWRNNGLSADFLADYVTTFLPRDQNDPTSLDRHSEIRGAVNYIANELLENAMKYSEEDLAHPTTIRLALRADSILFTAANSTGAERGQAFCAFVRELIDGNPAEIYVRQLERAAETGGSGLGLVTMINDYGATLAWRFENLAEGGMRVTTQVRLEI